MAALYKGLPGQPDEWTKQDELLATLIEVVDFGNRMFHLANFKQDGGKPEPLRIRRPWDEDEAPPPPPKPATPEEIARFFGPALKTPSKTKE